MRFSDPALAHATRRVTTALVLMFTLTVSPAHAVTLGFVEHFAGASIGGFGGGATVANPGAGGIGGAGDGMLTISVAGPLAGNLGAFTAGTVYLGNYPAAGVTQVKLWVKDMGTGPAGQLEMHLALGNAASGNFWQSNTGMIPSTSGWTQFTIDVSNGTTFSFIGSINSGFASAIQNVDRFLIRSDKAPYTKSPDGAIGTVGIDDITLTSSTAGVGAPHVSAGSPVRLAAAAPNPSRGSVAFRIESPAGEAIHVQVVDALGRVVRHQELLGADGGLTWQWDGADDRGVKMAPGMYRARAWSRFGGMSQPVVRVQ